MKFLRVENHIVWHASNQREREQIEVIWGHEVEVIIREDEVSLPQKAREPELHSSTVHFGYVSRIVPNKGLLEAIRAVTTLDIEITFTIYGPIGDEEYFRECLRLAANAPENCRILYAGELHPEHVRSAFQNFDAFIFPTRFENFGHVIAESLSSSCPVFAPDTTPWTKYLKDGGGFIMGSGNQSLAVLLKNFVSLSPEARFELKSQAGQTYNTWRKRRGSRHVFVQALDYGK